MRLYLVAVAVLLLGCEKPAELVWQTAELPTRSLSAEGAAGQWQFAAGDVRGSIQLVGQRVRTTSGWRDTTAEEVQWDINANGENTWRIVPRAGSSVALLQGVQLVFELESSLELRPVASHMGYGKYASTGFVSIDQPLAAAADGGIPAQFTHADLGLDPLVKGIAVRGDVGWWGTNVRLAAGAPVVGISACRAARWKTRVASGLTEHGVRIVLEQGSAAEPATTAMEADFEPVCLAIAMDAEEVDQALATAFETVLAPPPAGQAADAPRFFSTWHADFFGVTLDSIRTELQQLDRAGFAHEYNAFQIDDGFQVAWGDWLTTGKAFGGTVTDAASLIRGAGYRPGLWLTPSLVSENSSVFKLHPDWLLQDAQGRHVVCNSCSEVYSTLYALDWSHPDVPGWMDRTLRALQQAGYGMFKIDFLAASAAEGVGYDPASTSLDRYQTMLRTVRGAMQDDSLLWSATYPLLPTLGALHGYRVAADLGFQFFDGIPASTLMHYARALSTRAVWLQQFGWMDPDAFIQRGQAGAGRIEALAYWDAMAGGMYSTGDRPGDMDGSMRIGALPLPLQQTIGTRRSFLPADPYRWPVARWGIFPVVEELFQTGMHGASQDPLWFRLDADRRGADLVVMNWGDHSVVSVDLLPVLQRLAEGAIHLEQGQAWVLAQQGTHITVDVAQMEAHLLRLALQP